MPNATLDILAAGFQTVNVASPYGTLLCGLPAPFTQFNAPGLPFAVAIPPDCSLMGLNICSQGASIDANNAIGLTNALDVRVGDY